MLDHVAALDDAALLASMAESMRAERVATARRVIAAGMLAERRAFDDDAATAQWRVDDWDVAAAEVSAELGISRGRASADMSTGRTLLTRFPILAERFVAGDVDRSVITAIEYRTHLVQDPDILARLDDILTRMAPNWNAMSRRKLDNVLDWLVLDLDPEARRISRERDAERCVVITPDQFGMSEIAGTLTAVGGVTLDKRLDAMAATVCRDDPRTKPQRRADGMVALAEFATALVCECGQDGCAARAQGAPAAAQVIVHLVAEQTSTTGDGDKPGFVVGHGPIPAATVKTLVDSGRTKVRPPREPKGLGAEPRYRPSTGLADVVRSRDLTCRFPCCDAPADVCDVDHTVPWPFGPTHPSNTKSYCRFHHLMKTFWTGAGGWTDTQRPDGTITFVSPSGRRYATAPFGALFFPQLATPTGAVTPADVPRPADRQGPRTLMMPRRRRTRAANTAARITWERGVNRAWIAAHPPPF